MIRSCLFRNRALKIALKNELTHSKIVRCITCMCRAPRKKFTIRQGYLNFIESRIVEQSFNLRFYSDYPKHFKVLLPALSPTMENGTIISWEKKEGDKLNEGDLLAEIETDKATMGFETPEEGYLAKIIIPAGSKNVPIGKLVCIIVENEADVSAFKDYVDTGTTDAPAPAKSASPPSEPQPPSAPQPSKPPSTTSPPVSTPPSVKSASSKEKVYASPLAKKLAAEGKISLESVKKGSGLFGSIKSQDLAQAAQKVKAGKVGKAPEQSFEDISLCEIKKAKIEQIIFSKQKIPHYYLTVDINLDTVVALKNQINTLKEKENVKLDVIDFIIKAVASSCNKVPEANSCWMDTFIRQYNSVDVNLTIPTEKGLTSPIVFDANAKGLVAISTDVKNLAKKAKEGTLQANECEGGTITVSNLGIFGVSNVMSIVNPHQACTLTIAGVENRVIPDSKSERGFKQSQFVSVTLSCDHRVVDGAVGAQWLQNFRSYMENPNLMLM